MSPVVHVVIATKTCTMVLTDVGGVITGDCRQTSFLVPCIVYLAYS